MNTEAMGGKNHEMCTYTYVMLASNINPDRQTDRTYAGGVCGLSVLPWAFKVGNERVNGNELLIW